MTIFSILLAVAAIYVTGILIYVALSWNVQTVQPRSFVRKVAWLLACSSAWPLLVFGIVLLATIPQRRLDEIEAENARNGRHG